MHLVAGVMRLLCAQFLAAVYRGVRMEFIGRAVIRLCCGAFTAGAGLDNAVVEVIAKLGDHGIRLLKNESERRSEFSSLSKVMLQMLRR